MIDYISLLDEEEIKIIPELISGKAFKLLFQRNSEGFAKIKPGFRPSMISSNEAVSLAIKHIKRPFISSFINHSIDRWMKEIQESLDDMKARSIENDEALALTLMDSYFCDNIELYFKLIGKKTDDSYIEKLRSVAEKKQKEEKMKALETENEKTVTKDEVEVLTKQLTALNQQLKDNEDMYKSQLQSVQDDNASIKKALEDANQRIHELQYDKQKTESELANLKARVRVDDSEDVAEVASVDDYDYISLCEVQPVDYTGMSMMLRLADVGRNGSFEIFHEDEEQPKRFGNRNRLFNKNGPTEAGTIGVWKWRAKPNNSDPSKDFIESDFIPDVNPIEIVSIPDCKTEDDLLERIKNGVDVELTTPRILISVYLTKGQYVGFLCKRRDFQQSGLRIKLSDAVMSLPRYDFSIKDTIRFANGRTFYRSISIGIPSDVTNIRNPFDIVKTVIISRNSWQVFKQTGKTRSEWKSMRELLEGMDTVSVIDDIVHAANCSYKSAQIMLDDFIKCAEEYIDGNSIEDSIIAAVIAAKPDLMERCKSIIMEDWISDNLTAIEDAEKTIESLKKQIEAAKEELEKEKERGKAIILQQKGKAEEELLAIRTEHDSLVASAQELRDEINAKEQLAIEVEKSVEKRIRHAQANAADFIAELAFIPQSATKWDVQNDDSGIVHFSSGMDLSSEEIEKNKSWQDTLETISYELIDAGVATDFARPLAAYMYAAYLTRCPLIMVGPNSNAIVDAFSGSIFGRTAATLDCTDKYCARSVNECLSSSDDIIKIVNPFSSGWVNRVPEIMSKNSGKHFFAVYPFSEDILIEPKSLYSYMLPIFTELFIEKAPTGRIIGGKPADAYKEFSIVEGKKSHGKLLVEMHASLLIRTRIQTLLSNMHAMLGDQNSDYDVLFALFPFAYATMQMPLLINAIKNEGKKMLSVSKDLLETLVGMYGVNEQI